eukprot:TRINITY_DN2548_c0_g1_i1.p1 TRINITY_DN2548_c0_g1~~TRINITY_DN2548_c0_g1_i1.p1  ORF type:complete len:2184 (+),score=931.08 TRINITY_DN2548_c0_g1_i1:79-6552(+)
MSEITHSKDLGERTASGRNEPTSEVQSLRPHMGTLHREMGQKFQRERAPLRDAKGKEHRKRKAGEEYTAAKRLRSGEAISTDKTELRGSYVPKTRDTRTAHRELLAACRQALGDTDHITLVACCDELLEALKNPKVIDRDKKLLVEEVLGQRISEDNFRALLAISRRIVDYVHRADQPADGAELVADEQGVSVVFEESDDEGKDDVEMEVRQTRRQGDDAGRRADEDDDDDEDGEETRQDVDGGIAGGGMDPDDDDAAAQRDLIDAKRIDAHWIQREMGTLEENEDAHETQSRAEEVLQILQDESKNDQQVEGKLLLLFQYRSFDFIKVCLRNRWKVVWCTRISRAKPAEREEVVAQLMQKEYGSAIMDELQREVRKDDKERREFRDVLAKERAERRRWDDKSKNMLDLRGLEFHQGGRLNSKGRCELPPGSYRQSGKGAETFFVPAVKRGQFDEAALVQVKQLPAWAQPAFKGIDRLNPVQSRCFPCAFERPDNMLLCAPTGAGKTNVALLCILREIAAHVVDGELDQDSLRDLKMVYIAPMKALVQEVVASFSNRLECFDIKVSELTGDRSMTKAEIAESHIIVTTPEKWDIVTRKAGDRTYTQLVKLIIIDEIHLLHDSRGPVLEAVIARTIRQMEATDQVIRLVGLSATLPNYEDVATCMRVEKGTASGGGLFHFGNSYRPVPLQQQYIGVTEKNAHKRHQLMNEIVYEKVLEQAGKNQVLIFVHSRKDTAKTAKAVRDTALAKEAIGKFLKEDSASREILRSEVEAVKDKSLRDLLPYGFAIHHAGMNVRDRALVEDLFKDKHVQVLVSTATLAWGVNLPAHTVIIKGTQIYNPEKGRWTELSALDVMQMMGRAGRPGYDTHGEGIIITSHTELQYYLSLMNEQLPIESQFITRLVDQLNAEIVMGTVQNTKEANAWLAYTYLYVRMLRRPELYGVAKDEMEDDPQLEQRRADLVHTAASVLDRAALIKYDRKTGLFQSTDLGRVASHYYITCSSMTKFNEHLKPTMQEIDILRLFALADEFRFMTVREEEKVELDRLLQRVPIPIKETVDDPAAKVNALLQAHISQLKLEGFALMADMVYITQSASRLMRALFEVALRRRWAALADRCLNLAKMVERRMWLSHSPLRQFRVQPEVVHRLERKDLAWERYYHFSPSDVATLVGDPQLGKKVYRFIHMLPKLELEAQAQPITRSLLRIELSITADFQWDTRVHGASESFLVIVEDPDGEQILHSEPFVLREQFAKEEHYLFFHVPLFEPLPPQYFVRVVSERWLWSEAVLPISFRQLILPEKSVGHTELLDLKALPVSALQNPQHEKLYSGFTDFNSIQTQVFHTLMNTSENCLVCAPTGSGKTVCAEFALLRAFGDAREQRVRAVYCVAGEDSARQMYAHFAERFGARMGRKVVMLCGETTSDLKLLEAGELIVATAEHWDQVSRRWQRRKNVTSVRLFIADELHLLGSRLGPTLEIVVSRMRYIASQLKDHKIRIVGLAASLLHARDLGVWMGAPPQAIFNFHPLVRPVKLDIQIQGFDQPGFSSRTLAMYKPTYLAIRHHAGDRPAIVFTSSKRNTYDMVIELVTFCRAERDQYHFLHCAPRDIEPHLAHVQDKLLRQALSYGIGFFDEGQSPREREVVTKLHTLGAIQVAVACYTLCWQMEVSAHTVVVAGTQFYDGREHRHSDYYLTDILQMLGRACRPLKDQQAVAVVMCHSSKKEYLKKMLFEPYPVESHLDHYIVDHLNAEVVAGTIETQQDAVDYLTWTYLYRRLRQNPNFYKMYGVTHEHISEYMSELVENSIKALQTAGCLTLEEEKRRVGDKEEVVEVLTPANLGMIAAYYYTQYTTLELFASSVTEKTKLKGLLEILASASEFEDLLIRQHEGQRLQRLARHCPLRLQDPNFSDPHTKVNILLQCHFSRRVISADLEQDKAVLLPKCLPLISAMVDVIGSNRWLQPLLATMELSQMCVQGMWDKDSIFMQLPHFTPELCQKVQASGAESIFDLIDMDADQRTKLLGMTQRQLSSVAIFCNGYPNVELKFDVLEPDDLHQDAAMAVQVQLERDLDEGDPVPPVHCPLFPKVKEEGWWVVIGDKAANHVFAVKRVALQRKQKLKVVFNAPKQGKHQLHIFLMSDCYLGCDQEYAFSIEVREPLSDSDMDEDD